MVDTCQAASLYEKFTSPNILAVASSLVGEDSLSVSKYVTKNNGIPHMAQNGPIQFNFSSVPVEY